MTKKEKRPKYKNVYKVKPHGIFGFFEEHRFLSNFHLIDIEYEGRVYPSTENAYQAAKFPDILRSKFQDITPNEAKNLGRELKLSKDETERWNSKRISVMMELQEQKFRNPSLRKKLLETGGVYLEETNYWCDVFWGVYNSKGENNLGKILMEVRRNIKNG